MNQKAYVSFTLLFLGWLYCFWPSITPLFSFDWKDPYSYCIYVLFITTGFLVYAKREAIKSVAFASSQLGLLSLFLMSFLWIFAGVAGLENLKQLAIILMFPALILTAFGPYVARVLFFPIVYFTLLVPLYDQTFPWRFSVPWVAFGLLYSYFQYQNIISRILFVFLCFSISMLLPLLPIPILYSSLSAVILLLLIGEWMRGFKTSRISTPISEQPGRRFITMEARWMVPTLIALSFITTAPWLSENIRAFYPTTSKKVSLIAPNGVEGWQGPLASTTYDWLPIFRNASATIHAEYQISESNQFIYLFSAYYDSNRSVSDLLNPSNSLYNETFWKLEGTRASIVENLPIQELILKNQNLSRVQWSWYTVLGIPTADTNFMEILDKVRIIAKYADGSGMISISAYYIDDPEEARSRLANFLNAMKPSLMILERPEKFR